MVRTMFDEMMEKEEKWQLKCFLEKRKKDAVPGDTILSSLEQLRTSGHGSSRLGSSQSSPELPKIGSGPSLLTRRIQYSRKKDGSLFGDVPAWRQ
mmetsp:Transcript_23442/g.73064  ORF Transcript_23442/g.73064 Transcript_23442/m.73064 type:complete len:95 (+) Transcript_23442:73-357(+)